jgi:hypothetical protein
VRASQTQALVVNSCQTVPETGYACKQNGELLDLAERAGFDVFLTFDRGIVHQQNLTGRGISLTIVRTKSIDSATSDRLFPLFWTSCKKSAPAASRKSECKRPIF